MSGALGEQPGASIVVDIGNARIKWARAAPGPVLRDVGHALYLGDLDGAIVRIGAELPARVARFVVADVAEPALAARITALARQRYGLVPEFIKTTQERLGVRCGYREPSRLGVDRWVAILAAHHLARALTPPGPACVINAGTAITIDAVDAAGLHLGGLILAGPRLAADALDRNTRGIGRTSVAVDVPRGLELLGKSTDEAVGRGALLGPAAAFDRIIAVLRRELGAMPQVYLAGGDAARLAPWLETEAELRADLVLEGLALIAAGSSSRTAEKPNAGVMPAGGDSTVTGLRD